MHMPMPMHTLISNAVMEDVHSTDIEKGERGKKHQKWPLSWLYNSGSPSKGLPISFGTQLAISVGILTLAMVGIVSGVAWVISSKLLTTEIETRLRTISEVREEHTSLYLNNTFTALHLITSRIVLQDYLSLVHLGHNLTRDQQRYGNEDIGNSIASYRGVYVAEILDVSGKSILKSEKNGFANFLTNRGSIRMYPADAGNVSDPYIINENIGSQHEEAFVFSTLFESVKQPQVIMGSLRLLISTNELRGILSGLAGLEDKRGQVVLARPDIPNGTFQFIIPPRFDSLGGNGLLSDYECIEHIKLRKSENRIEKCISYNGVEVLGASRLISVLPSWVLLAELPSKVIDRPTRRLRNFLLLAIFSNLCAALLLSVIWAKHAVKPLRKLRESAYAFSHGDFTVRAQLRSPWFRNEISELDMAFNEMARDLEELYRNLERKVIERTQDLEVANSAKSSFLASISHEIRTPLNGIIGLATLLTESHLDPNQHDMALSIQECGEALLTIVNDVLDFSKIEAGKLTLENRPVDVQRAVQVCVYLLQGRANEKGIHLSCDFGEQVPRWILSDSVRLQQILLNLTGNAVKFTDEGSVHISTTAVPMNMPDQSITHRIRFAITDTGIGIPQTAISKLFQSFSQVDDSITRKYGGTGLGLAISKRLVELLQGSLHVESTEGQGSVFSFEIPVKLTEAPPDIPDGRRIKTPPTGQATEDETLGKRREVAILLAEDNAVNVKVVVAILHKLYFKNVDVVVNGLLAVDAVRQRSYDIVLMDMQMPVMGGLEATKIIREDQVHKQPVIIALTANAMEGDAKRCIESGMNDYLSKPINKETMLRCLLKYV